MADARTIQTMRIALTRFSNWHRNASLIDTGLFHPLAEGG